MSSEVSTELSTADAGGFEDGLDEAIDVANIPVLLMVLIQLTGERRWLEPRYRPSRPVGVDDNDDGGLPDEVQREIRGAARAALVAWHAGQPIAIPEPGDALLLEMLSASMGEDIPAEYGPLLAADLGATPTARRDVPTVPHGFTALIVGAGVSGLCAAVELQRAGVPYTILEKSSCVGGVWHENQYPAAGVDTPSHIYSFSFAQFGWSRFFALRDELILYLEHVADEFDVRPNIRFDTEVTCASYDEHSQGWVVEVVNGDGTIERLRANVLVSAIGIFNPPQYPSIPGLDRFEGPRPHTARWPDDIELDGRRVGVIGNGASAMQLVPGIADRVGSLTIFQRSQHWIMPFEKFGVPVTEPIRWLFREVPGYHAWYRLRLAWTFADKVHPSLQRDPSWPHADRSLNAKNDRYREFLTRYAETELEDRPDLLEKVIPTYPPYGKRMLLDNGWFKALRRANVELVTDAVEEVRADRVITATGGEHELDVLIIATGFDVSRFLTAFEIRGRSGRRLAEQEDNVQAYLGTVLPDLPNFFCLYGPNTQPHGGSIMFTIETQTHYMRSLLEQMFENGLAVAECCQDVCDGYNDRLDEINADMVWSHPGMRTYYRNSKGRVVVNSPYRNVDWWYMTRRANLSEYVVEVPAAAPSRGRQ